MKQEIVTNEQIKDIRNYYSGCKLWMMNKPQWRSWKFKLTDSTWKKFFIKDEKELRKLLIKYTPLRVFYSAIAVLNIQNIKGKQNKNFPIKIFQDLIIDIDNEDFEECRKSALQVIDRIKKEPDYCLKTFKGIHLAYFKQGGNKKRYLELIKDIPFVDTKTILNDYNEFSCPLTLNKGKVCILLTYEQLNAEIKRINELQAQIYEFIPNITPITPETPIEANETGLARPFSRKSTLRSRSKQWVDETGTGVTVLSFNNQVKNLYIPILIFDKNLNGLKQELDYLVNHYELGSLYVFESERYFCFISLKVMEKKRLSKLLNSSRSITKSQWFKFNKIWFNYSEFKPLTKINYPTKKYFRASRKHCDTLIKIGFPESKQINELVGKTPLAVYEVGMS